MADGATLQAVLGPTNTGKTHLAIERMCAHSSGAMGFPLRLLAREVYDRVVAIKGAASVALLTGEEKIRPPTARYTLATMESLPRGGDWAFVGLDEAQLGADAERGHVFTDRMLNVRGREETMILGAETLAPVIRTLIPDARITSRPRFSTLSYAGPRKLSRLPPRSAVIAFSADEVYALAEMLRRQRGGAAVVMGALSPRTRNAQVALFQSGDVDTIVATDAIGMGLNLDLAHVAFAGLTKFDGRRRRRLTVAEMAQIAGRAGRHHRDGTFGLLGADGSPLEFTPDELDRLAENRFPPLDTVFWRRGDPDTGSVEALIASLEEKPQRPRLRAAPEATDLAVARLLSSDPRVVARASGERMVRRFWSACGVPDFQKLGAEHHARFVARLWSHLSVDRGHVPADVIGEALARLERMDGDIAALAGRLSAVRSWAYVAHRDDWVADPAHWSGRAGEVETRLSDALHERLTQRFVDRRTSVLMKQIGLDARHLPVDIAGDGVVRVEGETVGTLDGFRFRADPSARLADKRMLLAAADRVLVRERAGRADALVADGDDGFALDCATRGWRITWRGWRVARLSPGRTVLDPRVTVIAEVPDPGGAVAQRLERWLTDRTAQRLAPLARLDEGARDLFTPAPLRAIYAALVEGGGAVWRTPLATTLAQLPPADRQRLRRDGVVPGSLDLFVPRLLKPRALLWLAALRAIAADERPHGLPTFEDPWIAGGGHPGFRPLGGGRSLRVDLAERVLADLHRQASGGQASGGQASAGQASGGRTGAGSTRSREGARRAAFVPDPALASSLGLTHAELGRLIRDAGFRPVDADRWRFRGLSRPPQRRPAPPRPDNHFADLRVLLAGE